MIVRLLFCSRIKLSICVRISSSTNTVQRNMTTQTYALLHLIEQKRHLIINRIGKGLLSVAIGCATNEYGSKYKAVQLFFKAKGGKEVRFVATAITK